MEAGNSNNSSSSNNVMLLAIVSGTGKLMIAVCSNSIRARAYGKEGRRTNKALAAKRGWGESRNADGMNSIVQ